MQRKIPLFLFSLLIVLAPVGAKVRQYEQKNFDETLPPETTAKEHFEMGYSYLCDKNYPLAKAHFFMITTHFKESDEYARALFLQGVSHYFLNEFKKANQCFSNYLLLDDQEAFFEKIFAFKYAMAEHYRQGLRKPLWGVKKFPRWLPSKEDALELYEEVIIALPSKELAAKALYGKGQILKDLKRYEESTDTLQTLHRRFPTHPLAAEGYLLIADIYLEQCKRDAQNPYLLGLAIVNQQAFEESFPQDERQEHVATNIAAMQELLATSLYDTGCFYERKSKPHSSLIYYNQTVSKYPTTGAAKKCQDRIDQLETPS